MPAIRRELYKRITDAAKAPIEDYYHEFPDRFDDERSKDAMRITMAGLRLIKEILEDYNITRKEK